MLENLKKTDKVCNNVYLIDERFCLSNSFDIINSNFTNLSSSYQQLKNAADHFNQLYTYFISNSSTWNIGAINTNSKSSLYNDVYNLTTSLSATWSKEFSIFYPQLIEIDDYYNNLVFYKNLIKNWLTFIYPPQKFSLNQKIYVYINLYQINLFTFRFSGSYNEKCRPITPPKQVLCTGNSCGDLFRGCNLDENGRHFCINAYTRCGRSVSASGATATCTSTGAKQLKLLSVTNNYKDNYTARCVMMTFSKTEDGPEWIIEQ
jgi:hypothetical protein